MAGSGFKKYSLLIFSLSLGNFMSAIDATIVTVALPTISKLFGITPGNASWIMTIYVLVMAGSVLIFGKISDMVGFKKVFLYGFTIFTIGSFAAGFLPVFLNSFPILIVSRMFQAVGASMITAIGPAMITAYIPMDIKGKAMGTFFTIQALGAAIGPTIGGILTQQLSWSWIFFINIPIGIAAIMLGLKVIPDLAAKKWKPGFDRAGAALIFIGLASLLFTLSEGQTFGWTSLPIMGSIVLTLLMIGGFFWHELSLSDPLLEIRLFQKKNFLLTNMLTSLMFFTFSGVSYLLPFYLQFVQGRTPSVIGIIFSSFSVAIMIGGVLAGTLYNRLGGRTINITAGILGIVGYSMITCFRADTSSWFIVLSLLFVGSGAGLILTSTANMIMNSVSKQYQGMISSFTSLERFIPMLMGVTIFNIIFVLGLARFTSTDVITKEVMSGLTIAELSGGFEQVFVFTLVAGIIILALSALAFQEIHPDYRQVTDQPDQ